MLFDQSVTDAQAKPSSLAYTFGGVKRFENAMRLFEPGPRVLKHNRHQIVLRRNHHFEPALRVRFAVFNHCIYRVVNDIQEDLLELVGISADCRNSRSDLALQLNAADFHVVVA